MNRIVSCQIYHVIVECKRGSSKVTRAQVRRKPDFQKILPTQVLPALTNHALYSNFTILSE